MPRVKRRPKTRRVDPLSQSVIDYLCTGYHFGTREPDPAPLAAEAWKEIGDLLIDDYSKSDPGHRPHYFWKHVAIRSEHESEPEALHRLGLLLPQELEPVAMLLDNPPAYFAAHCCGTDDEQLVVAACALEMNEPFAAIQCANDLTERYYRYRGQYGKTSFGSRYYRAMQQRVAAEIILRGVCYGFWLDDELLDVRLYRTARTFHERI